MLCTTVRQCNSATARQRHMYGISSNMIYGGGGGGLLPKTFPTPLYVFPTMEFVLEEICHKEGRFAIWYYFPRGSSAMGFLPGKVYLEWGTLAIWYNFRGENLPWYWLPHHEICGGGGRFTIEGEALPYGIVSPLWDFFGGTVCHMVFLRVKIYIWNVCHMV